MSIPRRIHRRVPNLVTIGPAVWQLPKTFECVTPTPPPYMPPGVYEGWLVFSLCPFPDESADVNQSWCQSVQRFYSFPWLLNVWPPLTPPPPKCPLCLSGQFVWRISIPRWICTCVPNLMPIGPAVWHIFPCILNLWPPTPPPHVEGRIPRRIRRRVPNFVPIGPVVWQPPKTLWFVTPKTPRNAPCVLRFNWFGIYPFPDESAHGCQIWC